MIGQVDLLQNVVQLNSPVLVLQQPHLCVPGPNMVGNSTMLRSVAAMALQAAAGLQMWELFGFN